MNDFTQTKETRSPISRVRIVHHVNKYLPEAGGWHVEVLPAGKSRWWWNWDVAARCKTEKAAREEANRILERGYISRTEYVTNEATL